MKIKEFQSIKEHPVITIRPNATIHDAVEKLVEHKIGALPVCDGKGKLLGIITERDILEGCRRHGAAIESARVRDVMTREMVIAIPEDDISYVMEVMTRKKIRHVPVMKGQKVGGIISARDIIEHQLEESRSKVRYLSDYLDVITAVLQSGETDIET